MKKDRQSRARTSSARETVTPLRVRRNPPFPAAWGSSADAGRAGPGARATAGVVLFLAAVAVSACDPPAEPPADVPVGTDVGLRAPSLVGVVADGSRFDLAEVDGLAVLVFYRSAECGLCRLQLEGAQRNLAAYAYKGVRLIGVTLDAPEISLRMVDQSGIEYPLVSVDRTVFEAWGTFPDGAVGPLPATYIVRNGLIQFRHIGRNASDRTTDAGVLTVIEGLDN